MKRGIVISDLQCGSIYGILPDQFVTGEDVHKPQNPGQAYLWACWIDYCNKAREFNPDFVVLNGDLVDGKQQAQKGTELSLPLMDDQRRAAVECLTYTKNLLRPECKWYAVAGTVYHVGDGNEYEEAIAREMGCEPYKGAGTGRLCREILDLDVEGVIINFAHHISVNSGFYRATAADREGQWSAMTAKDQSKGVPKADVVIRSHVHNFIHVEHASKHIIQTPCWQLQTRFMRKHSAYRMLPDIGGIFLEVDGDAKKRGEDPLRLTKHLYSLPPAPVTKL